MLKIYGKREEEIRLIPLLAEFKVRVVASFPIKGQTRKIAKKNAYKVVNFPLGIDMGMSTEEFNESAAEYLGGK